MATSQEAPHILAKSGKRAFWKHDRYVYVHSIFARVHVVKKQKSFFQQDMLWRKLCYTSSHVSLLYSNKKLNANLTKQLTDIRPQHQKVNGLLYFQQKKDKLDKKFISRFKQLAIDVENIDVCGVKAFNKGISLKER